MKENKNIVGDPMNAMTIFKRVCILASVILIITLFLWPEESIPSFEFGSFPKSQYEEVLSLERGVSYEQEGEFVKALEEYQKVLGSKSEEISAAASLAIERVIYKQANPWLSFRISLRTFLIDLAQYLTWLIILGIVALLLWQMVQRFPRRSGIELQPFEIVTSTQDNGDIPRQFQQSLIDTFHGAQAAHCKADQSFTTLAENLTLPSAILPQTEQNALDKALQELGSIQIAGMAKVDIRALLNFAQELMNRREYVLTGTLRQFEEKKWSVTAELTQARNGKIIHRWEARDNAGISTEKNQGECTLPEKQDSDNNIFELGQRLAYRIQYDLLRDRQILLESESWVTFQYLTEGLRALQRYGIGTADTSCLTDAAHCFENAISIDLGHQLARFYLGLVYSSLGKNKKAAEIFEEILSSRKQWRDELASQILKKLKLEEVPILLRVFYWRSLNEIKKYQPWNEIVKKFENILKNIIKFLENPENQPHKLSESKKENRESLLDSLKEVLNETVKSGTFISMIREIYGYPVEDEIGRLISILELNFDTSNSEGFQDEICFFLISKTIILTFFRRLSFFSSYPLYSLSKVSSYPSFALI